MALKPDKYDIEVQNDYAIKPNQIFFHFMQQTFNRLDGLYLHGKILLIDTIIENQSRKQTKIRKVHPSILQKRLFCE